MNRFSLSWLFSAAIMLCACSGAQPHKQHDGPRAVVLQYGQFERLRPGHIYQPEQPGAGPLERGAILRLAQAGPCIPLKPGVYFGFQYRISGLPPTQRRLPLHRVLTQPPMFQGKGHGVSTSRKYELPIRSGSVFDIIGYAFHEPHELIPGLWRFEIWHQQERLLVQEITVYSEEQPPTKCLPDMN